MFGKKIDLHEENRRMFKCDLDNINKRLDNLINMILPFKLEVMMYINDKDEKKLAKLMKIQEDMYLDLTELSAYLKEDLDFMLNNNMEQFKDLLIEAGKLQKQLSRLMDTFAEVSNNLFRYATY